MLRHSKNQGGCPDDGGGRGWEGRRVPSRPKTDIEADAARIRESDLLRELAEIAPGRGAEAVEAAPAAPEGDGASAPEASAPEEDRR